VFATSIVIAILSIVVNAVALLKVSVL